MDLGIWAIWYDLPEQKEDEYLRWLHEIYIPGALARHGYLWAAHVRKLTPEERSQGVPPAFSIPHTDDPTIPTGNRYLLLFGAEHPHVFVDPSPAEMAAKASAEDPIITHRPINRRRLQTAKRVAPPVGRGFPRC